MLLLLTAATASAGEVDGAVAPAMRWTGPRGPASGSYRSEALAVATEVEEAWSITFDRISASPVHWDGIGYIVGVRKKKHLLVAFDLDSGREIAKSKLKGFLPLAGLHVWDGQVFLQTENHQISSYRVSGSRMKLQWVFRGRTEKGVRYTPQMPVVHDNEIYCWYGGPGDKKGHARLRPGSQLPVWVKTEAHGFGHRSRLAVRGPYLFGAWLEPDGFQTADPRARGREVTQLHLGVYRRSDGGLEASRKVCQAFVERDLPRPEITVTESAIYIGSHWPLLSSGGEATYVRVPYRVGSSGISFDGRAGLWRCRQPPADHPSLGAIVLAEGEGGGAEWRRYKGDSLFLLTTEKDQPDLFASAVPPAILGDVCYFGTWAADLRTKEILWRLSGVNPSSAAVPADGHFLVVDDQRVLRAYRGRGRR